MAIRSVVLIKSLVNYQDGNMIRLPTFEHTVGHLVHPFCNAQTDDLAPMSNLLISAMTGVLVILSRSRKNILSKKRGEDRIPVSILNNIFFFDEPSKVC